MRNLLIGIGVLVIIGMFSVGRYNSLIEMNEGVDKSWADMDIQYQRRADLIPNLVSTVKGYAEHEKEVLIAVAEARAKATAIKIDPSKMTTSDLQNFSSAQNGLTSALAKLMALSERYPDLKANQGFLQLQAQLEGTENRIAVARNRYGEVVKEFNSSIKTFPNVIFASMLGYEKKPYFEAKEGTDVPPEVKF